jgi:hypothetical protein
LKPIAKTCKISWTIKTVLTLIHRLTLKVNYSMEKAGAYGVELLIKKTEGKFTGWVGYTFSRAERKIAGINDGNWYNARQARTHDLSVVGMYELTERWSI